MKILKKKCNKEINFILILFLFSFLAAGNSFSQERYVLIMPNGLRTTHTAEIINNTAYLPLSQISPVLFPKGQYDESRGEIKLQEGTLRILPLSFFLVFNGKDSVRAAQMTLPAIIYKSLLYVPAETFFKALETLGLYNVKVERNIIGIKNPGNKRNIVKLQETVESKSISKVAPDNKRVIDTHPKKKIRKPVFSESFNSSIKNFRSGLLSLKSLMSSRESGVNEKNIQPIIKQNESDTTQKPPLKGMGKPVNKVYPPNLYVLPQNLIRKELDEKSKEKEQDSTKNELMNMNGIESRDDNLFASNSLLSLVSLPQVVKYFTEIIDDTLKIHIITDKIISSYQVPECSGKNVVLRLPDAINSVDDLPKNNGIEQIKVENIREILVYRIKLSEEPVSCTSSRIGPKEIVYSIIFPPRQDVNKKQKNRVEQEKKIEPKNETSEEELPDTNVSSQGFENEKKKWTLDVIVLDPGHGGFDPGAISVNGYKEKDLTLDIALKVRDLIEENMPHTKIVMTRSDDRFIELYRRGQIANQSKGKLFISIHMNSAATKPNPANGFETYMLRPGRNDDAVKVANFENSVINLEKKKDQYAEITGEKLIIATMAQAAFVKFSELFAKILQDEVSKTTPLTDRGVNQAGFYVLVGASMPNVLFETAFLSNKEDQKFVTSEKGQNKIAKGIFNAIKRYAEEYQKICK